MLSLLILTILTGSSQAEELVPPLELPELPEAQEGDDLIIEVTVGEQRNALYYYRAYPILLDYVEDLKARLVEQAMMTDQERIKRVGAEMKLDVVRGQRNTSLIVNVGQLGLGLLLLGVQ